MIASSPLQGSSVHRSHQRKQPQSVAIPGMLVGSLPRAYRHRTHGSSAARPLQAWLKFLEPKVAPPAPALQVAPKKPDAKDVITRFYAAYNAGDLDTIASLMADDVEYHDMIYEEPFRGKAQVMNFMAKVRDTVPQDLQFVVDDITSGDPSKVGIMWHVEIGEGTVFPFSRGCSFYTVNEQGQIVQGRDLVESAAKPGSSALQLLTLLAPLIRKLGPKADPSQLKRLPLAAAAVWAFYTGYTAYIMLGTSAPGLPAWQTPPEVLQEVLNESLNFWYVNIGLNAIGITLVPSIAEPPVSEALFNAVAAWGVLFLPVMLTEAKSKKVGNVWAWWSGIMLLTNVFFIPFLALRAAPDTAEGDEAASSASSAALAGAAPQPGLYPSWTRASAAAALAVGLFSIGWALVGRPEYGGLEERWAYFESAMSSSRVFYAFVVDATLYSVWQAAMLSNIPTATAAQKFVPFFGLAAHLLTAPQAEADKAEETVDLQDSMM